ncbi:MAG: hypothetical protein LBC92_03630, partial [Rickettsiales bacterium]|nr:hypothetical protein [Rickettsiales bacterium]
KINNDNNGFCFGELDFKSLINGYIGYRASPNPENNFKKNESDNIYSVGYFRDGIIKISETPLKNKTLVLFTKDGERYICPLEDFEKMDEEYIKDVFEQNPTTSVMSHGLLGRDYVCEKHINDLNPGPVFTILPTHPLESNFSVDSHIKKGLKTANRYKELLSRAYDGDDSDAKYKRKTNVHGASFGNVTSKAFLYGLFGYNEQNGEMNDGQFENISLTQEQVAAFGFVINPSHVTIKDDIVNKLDNFSIINNRFDRKHPASATKNHLDLQMKELKQETIATDEILNRGNVKIIVKNKSLGVGVNNIIIGGRGGGGISVDGRCVEISSDIDEIEIAYDDNHKFYRKNDHVSMKNGDKSTEYWEGGIRYEDKEIVLSADANNEFIGASNKLNIYNKLFERNFTIFENDIEINGYTIGDNNEKLEIVNDLINRVQSIDIYNENDNDCRPKEFGKEFDEFHTFKENVLKGLNVLNKKIKKNIDEEKIREIESFSTHGVNFLEKVNEYKAKYNYFKECVDRLREWKGSLNEYIEKKGSIEEASEELKELYREHNSEIKTICSFVIDGMDNILEQGSEIYDNFKKRGDCVSQVNYTRELLKKDKDSSDKPFLKTCLARPYAKMISEEKKIDTDEITIYLQRSGFDNTEIENFKMLLLNGDKLIVECGSDDESLLKSKVEGIFHRSFEKIIDTNHRNEYINYLNDILIDCRDCFTKVKKSTEQCIEEMSQNIEKLDAFSRSSCERINMKIDLIKRELSLSEMEKTDFKLKDLEVKKLDVNLIELLDSSSISNCDNERALYYAKLNMNSDLKRVGEDLTNCKNDMDSYCNEKSGIIYDGITYLDKVNEYENWVREKKIKSKSYISQGEQTGKNQQSLREATPATVRQRHRRSALKDINDVDKTVGNIKHLSKEDKKEKHRENREKRRATKYKNDALEKGKSSFLEGIKNINELSENFGSLIEKVREMK